MPCTPLNQLSTPIREPSGRGCPVAIAVVSRKAGCCPEGLPPGPPNTVLGNSPDGQGYAWFLMHPPAHLVSQAEPFSWDDAAQCGVIPLPGRLVDNGNGSFTFTPGDGSAPTTIAWTITHNDAPFSWNPATWSLNLPQTASLVQNPDGSFTFYPGDGSAPVTVPLLITNNAAPFSWNPATRSLNVPQSPTLVQNADGSFTFTAGEGSAPITVPLLVTNNVAPFSWNPTTRSLNVPQTERLVANPDGSFTFIAGDGSPSVTIPKDCCPSLTTNPDGSLSWTNGAGVTTTEGHPRMSVTFTDGAGNTFDPATQTLNIDFPAIPPDVFLAGTSYDPATHVLTLTMSDGSVYTVNLADLTPVVSDGLTVIGDGTSAAPLRAGNLVDNGNSTYTWTAPGGSTVTLTANPAPFSWDSATQTGNLPLPTLLANADGSFTYDPGDGSAPVIIPADCCPTLVDNGDGTYTYSQNDGSAPVTISSHPALILTQNQDITSPTARASLNTAGQVLNLPPEIYAARRYDGPTQGQVLVNPGLWQIIPLTNATPGVGVVLDSTASLSSPMATASGLTIVRAGFYELWGQITWQPCSADGAIHIIALTVNGAIYQRVPYPGISTERFNTYAHFRNYLAVGDVIGLQAYTKDPFGNEHFSADLTVHWLHD